MVRRFSKICSQFVIIVYDGGRYSTDLRTQKPLKTSYFSVASATNQQTLAFSFP